MHVVDRDAQLKTDILFKMSVYMKAVEINVYSGL